MSCANGVAVALPRASAFSPRLRIVAWSDTSSVRRKLMYGSQVSLTDKLRSSYGHSHDILSTKSLRDRPQTIPYRPKSGALSGRPCSAPPPRSKTEFRTDRPTSGDCETMQKRRENLRVTTLNIALPNDVTGAKPMYNFQPKIPPKKHVACPPWASSPAGPNGHVPVPSPTSYCLGLDQQKTYVNSDIKKKIKRARTMAPPKKDLHLSHRIAHLTQQINDCGHRSNSMLTT